MPTVGIVLINWNSAEYTLRCVSSIERGDFKDYRIYVVDNASADNSLETLSRLGNSVQLIANKSNDGWAGGGNVGVKAAMADGCEHIFLLNNDAEVQVDTIGRLVAAGDALGPSVVLGSLVIDKPTEEIQFLGTEIDPGSGTPRWFNQTADAHLVRQDYIPSATIHGAALFARADHFRKVGLFDERFFLNFDDTDWCTRAIKAGLRCMVVTLAMVEHFTSGSIGGVESPLQFYFLYRNELLFGRKHCSPRQRLVIVARMARAFLRTVRREMTARPRAFRQTRAAVRGVLDFVLRRFGDCPTSIRRLHAEWRARPAAA